MTNHVKIYGVKPRIQYTADGSLSTYEFPFAVFNASNLDVYLGEEKQESSTYTVAGSGSSDGGSVTFATVPQAGTVITLMRNLSITRTTDFQEGGALRADTLNDELDYQIACTQQIAENLNRSMVLPPYAADNDLDLTLPTPSAGKAIVWNSDGTNLENSTVEINALESTLKGYKESAESAASTATTKAGIASDKADVATNKAQLASDKADIATSKAAEAASTVSSKANKDMDNLSDTGKTAVVALGRNFTTVNQQIAEGIISIAGEYDLGLTDNKVKMGLFKCVLQLSGNGESSMSIGSDVVSATKCLSTNNQFSATTLVWIPFKTKVSIDFPSYAGGIVAPTSLTFIGYM